MTEPHGIDGRFARREFLKGAGAVLAANALGAYGLRPAAAAERMKAMASGNGFKETGIWHFHPSIFEYSLGPWQPSLPSNPDLVKLWKQTIDWYADAGMDWIVLHFAPYGGTANPSPIKADRVRFGWGYHYTLDFKKYPEAKTFEADFVKRNQEIVRAITDYGKEKGVAVYFHHYNFFNTQPFLKAHPELGKMEFLRKGNFVEVNKPGGWFVNTGKELTYDACWNKPLYKDFMVACWEEFFELFPSAAGLLMTPGERARCRCIDCIGPQPSLEVSAGARYRDSPQKRETLADFCGVFYKTMQKLGKRPLIRSWIAGVLEAPDEWARILPKGPIYVTKYSVFDMIDTGVDPLAKAFNDAGHETWLMKEYIGSENAGPVVMTIPKSFDMVAEKSREFGTDVVMGVDNGEHGFTYKSRRVQYLPEILWANSFGKKRQGDPQEIATKYYTGIFGKKGPAILRAVEQYSELPYQISRLMFAHTEGFTWKFPVSIEDIGGKAMDPPEWVKREIVAFADYLKYLETNPWDDTFRKKITGKGKDPIEVLEQLTEMSKEAHADLVKLAKDVPADAKDEIDLLVLSAQLCFLTGKRFGHFFRARLYAAGAQGSAPESVRKDLAKRALAEMEQGVQRTKDQRPVLATIPNDLADPMMTMNGQGGEEATAIADHFKMATALAPLLGIPAPTPTPVSNVKKPGAGL